MFEFFKKVRDFLAREDVYLGKNQDHPIPKNRPPPPPPMPPPGTQQSFFNSFQKNIIEGRTIIKKVKKSQGDGYEITFERKS